MATWSRNKVDSTQLNNGNEFDNNSSLALNEINAVVNGGLYSQDFAEHLADAPDTSEAGNVGIPAVSLVDNIVGDKTFKKFKFSNLKGQKGDKGEQGEQGDRGIPIVSKIPLSYTGTMPPTIENYIVSGQMLNAIPNQYDPMTLWLTDAQDNLYMAIGQCRSVSGSGDFAEISFVGATYKLTGDIYESGSQIFYVTEYKILSTGKYMATNANIYPLDVDIKRGDLVLFNGLILCTADWDVPRGESAGLSATLIKDFTPTSSSNPVKQYTIANLNDLYTFLQTGITPIAIKFTQVIEGTVNRLTIDSSGTATFSTSQRPITYGDELYLTYSGFSSPIYRFTCINNTETYSIGFSETVINVNYSNQSISASQASFDTSSLITINNFENGTLYYYES